MSTTGSIFVTQSDAAVYIVYDLPAGQQRLKGIIPLDTLLTLSAQTDMETRPVLQLGVPYQTGYTTGSMVQAGQMAFPASIDSPFQKYIEIVKQQEQLEGEPLRNRYMSGPSEWYGEEFLPQFSLLVAYIPEITKTTNNTVDISYIFIPGVKITQRSEEQTPENVTIILYRFQQLGMFRYKQTVSVANKQIDLDVSKLVQFKPYGEYFDMYNTLIKVVKSE